MASLDLLDHTATPDGWHDVRAPGGYEWWYFDAEDAATDTQVVAIFMQGFIFHPGYLRAFKAFRRHPTRTAPPTAGDFPSVYLCVYHNGKIDRQFFTQYPRDAFRADAHRVNVTIGPNRLVQDDSGVYRMSMTGTPWKLTARGPQTLVDHVLSAELTFAPRPGAAPATRRFLSREMTDADHEWFIAAPRCDVTGMLAVAGATATADARVHAFTGRGYHDHNYGTAPIGDGLRRWTWGRAMFDSGRVVTFHHVEPRETHRPTETHLVEVRADGAIVDHLTNDVRLGEPIVCKPAMMLRYPASLDFGDRLRLSAPRVVDPSPFYLRLQYAADSFGERSTAFCEIAYPHRLRWPLLGRMIEMSFDKRPLRRVDGQ